MNKEKRISLTCDDPGKFFHDCKDCELYDGCDYFQKVKKSKMTLELCAHCSLEVKIPDDKASNCPICRNEILPCGDCDEPGRNCDWTAKDRCHKYPRNAEDLIDFGPKGGFMKVGDIVQAWSETEYKCLGWGKIIEVAYSEETKEGIPLIQLESGKTIWGDRCGWITEKKAIEIGLSVFLKTMGRKFS